MPESGSPPISEMSRNGTYQSVFIRCDGEAPAVVAGFASSVSKRDPHPAASWVRGSQGKKVTV